MIWIATINSNINKDEKVEIKATGMRALALKINKETNLNISQNTLHNIYWNRAKNKQIQITKGIADLHNYQELVTVAKAPTAD